jgi:hypothetical protein
MEDKTTVSDGPLSPVGIIPESAAMPALMLCCHLGEMTIFKNHFLQWIPNWLTEYLRRKSSIRQRNCYSLFQLKESRLSRHGDGR